jgi:hypothetical protein
MWALHRRLLRAGDARGPNNTNVFRGSSVRAQAHWISPPQRTWRLQQMHAVARAVAFDSWTVTPGDGSWETVPGQAFKLKDRAEHSWSADSTKPDKGAHPGPIAA